MTSTTSRVNTRDIITLEELRQHGGQKGSSWTCIGDTIYDISDFVPQHPGGSIIRLSAGRDATTLFESSHPKGSWSRVNSTLQNKIPVVGRFTEPVPTQNREFFTVVRERVDEHLRKKNLGRHRPYIAFSEAVITSLMYLIATYYTDMRGSYWWAAILGFFTGRLGFIMHTGNHMGIGGSLWANKFAGWMMDLIGANHLTWAFEHQVAHHMDPNELGKDNDCEIGDPLLRFHPHIKRKWWHKYQHFLTFIGMSVGLYKWIAFDFVHFFQGKIGSVQFHTHKTDRLVFLSFKVVWIMLHVVIPWYYHGFLHTMGLMAVFMIVGGHYIENVFIVNHIQDGLIPPQGCHWSVRQVTATANWSSGSHFWNWLSGGLNHQIEHHLFPSYSIYVYPEIAPVVQQTCKDFNLPYVNYSNFAFAWLSTAGFLKNLGSDSYDQDQKNIKKID